MRDLLAYVFDHCDGPPEAGPEQQVATLTFRGDFLEGTEPLMDEEQVADALIRVGECLDSTDLTPLGRCVVFALQGDPPPTSHFDRDVDDWIFLRFYQAFERHAAIRWAATRNEMPGGSSMD